MPRVRILICEDQGLTTLRVERTLTALGFEVVGVVTDGMEAVKAAETLAPDLILMDIEMPRLNGLAATERIMVRTPTAIVMLSAYGDYETVSTALAAGAVGYVVKPVTDEQLQTVIGEALVTFGVRKAAVQVNQQGS